MGKKRGRRGAAALVLALASTLPAEHAGALTLSDALVTAVLTSPELAQSRAQTKILAERAIQARSAGRIQAEGRLDLFANYADLERFQYPNQMILDVTQPLYTGGQVANATEAALNRMTAQEARVIATEQLVLLNAVQAYLDVQSNATLVEIAENSVRVIGEQLRAAEERFNVGEVTRTDVAQAEARLAATRSLLAARIGALAVSREAFRRDVGVYPEDLQPLPPLPDLPDSLDLAVSIAMTEAPEILAARLERIAAGNDVRAAIGALLPQVSLAAQVGRMDAFNVRGDAASADATIGVRVTLPFYNGGFNYSRIRESQALVEANEADIVTEMRNAAERVGTAWSDLQVAVATIRAGELEVEAAQIAFEGVREEAKVGARTTLDVLDAEQELLDARGSLVVSRRDQYFASYALLFAIGKLTIEHLGLDIDDVPPVGAYYASVEDRDFGYDPSDDTVWTLSYRP